MSGRPKMTADKSTEVVGWLILSLVIVQRTYSWYRNNQQRSSSAGIQILRYTMPIIMTICCLSLKDVHFTSGCAVDPNASGGHPHKHSPNTSEYVLTIQSYGDGGNAVVRISPSVMAASSRPPRVVYTGSKSSANAILIAYSRCTSHYLTSATFLLLCVWGFICVVRRYLVRQMNVHHRPFAELLVDLMEERLASSNLSTAAASNNTTGIIAAEDSPLINTRNDPRAISSRDSRSRRRRMLFGSFLFATADVEHLRSVEGYSALQIAYGLPTIHTDQTILPSTTTCRKRSSVASSSIRTASSKSVLVTSPDSNQIKDSEEKEEEECCICLESLHAAAHHPYVSTLAGCNHSYHYVCVGEWLRRNKKCPVCRRHVDLH